MLLDITQTKTELKISKVNSNKKLDYIHIPIPQNEKYEWVVTKPSTRAVTNAHLKCWDGETPIFKKSQTYLNKYRVVEMIDNLPEKTQQSIYEFNEPYKVFCDIETEIIDGFPNIEDPKEKITVVGFYFEETHTARVYGIRDIESEARESYDKIQGRKSRFISPVNKIQDQVDEYFKDFPEMKSVNFEYVYFESEYDMLYHIFSTIIKEALVLTGWFFVQFDWNYMLARCRRLGIKPEICAADGKFVNDYNLEDRMVIEVPKHKIVIDYLKIFKKWSGMDKQLENMSLDTVSNVVLGVKKIAYPGSLQQLYEQDIDKYVYYNIVDTLLVFLIDKRKKTFNIMCNLAQIGKIETKKALSPVHFTEMTLCRAFYAQGKVLPVDFKPHEREDEKLYKYGNVKGGWVKPPRKGLFKILCGTDFASLYPSLMRVWGISPEAYMGYYEDRDFGRGKIAKVRNESLTPDVVAANRYTPMKTLFRAGPSVMRDMLDGYYASRVEFKTKMKELDPQIAMIKRELARRNA